MTPPVNFAIRLAQNLKVDYIMQPPSVKREKIPTFYIPEEFVIKSNIFKSISTNFNVSWLRFPECEVQESMVIVDS
jgi:hypothetical protein